MFKTRLVFKFEIAQQKQDFAKQLELLIYMTKQPSSTKAIKALINEKLPKKHKSNNESITLELVKFSFPDDSAVKSAVKKDPNSFVKGKALDGKKVEWNKDYILSLIDEKNEQKK
ncbi:hypothetical protein ELUMI_v1c05310 [Williamsoniiplasma luminosum]|uniref:Uncharacterized protein n=1 Tax=Williamsoniiplasma luminosum TaxID=214888 RepID=A0A2K8NTS7_9MOLU|nr:hypothetical protein [Williamsoniiplasma luminosum]ATZ17255.1 hypothetical protein ELUMI_v1c05310 [Williamsoniiplasma luminosum]